MEIRVGGGGGGGRIGYSGAEGERRDGSEVKGQTSYGNGDWIDRMIDRSIDRTRRREGKRRMNDLDRI